MNDATEVSLETDRLEQLLEGPSPVQPVVMIQYRNRGAPWWVLASLLLVVPVTVGAVMFYYHFLVERYREQASKAVYLQQTQAAAPEPAVAQVAPGPGRTDTADASVLQVAGSAEPAPGKTTKAETSPSAESTRIAPIDHAEQASGSSLTGVDEPSRPRVRSILSPFDTENQSPASNGTGGNSAGPSAGAEGNAAPGESSGGKLASGEKDARDSARSTPGVSGNVGPPGPDSPAAHSSDAAVAKGAGGNYRPEAQHDLEPLPTREEMVRQLAEESAQKLLKMAEEQAASVERIRVLKYEQRVKFRDELRQILAARGKSSKEEIDALASRSVSDHDAKVFTKARNIWRYGKMSQQAKVSQIRALDIPESDILSFISDNLFARMHTRSGPRDDNEARVRAARLLLSYELPGLMESPGTTSNPLNVFKPREAAGARPK